MHGISAFAFQGTNAHVVLEHWAPEGGCGAAFDSEVRGLACTTAEDNRRGLKLHSAWGPIALPHHDYDAVHAPAALR